MDLEIKQKDGTKYKLSDFGFRVKDIVIESPEIEDNYETKETQVVVCYLVVSTVKGKLRCLAMLLVQNLMIYQDYEINSMI